MKGPAPVAEKRGAALVRGLRSENGIAAAFFVLATVLMTWPVAPRLATHLAGSGGDGWVFVWSQWWIAFALGEAREAVFRTQHLYYPESVGLYTNTLALVNSFASLPLQWAAGPLVSTNLAFLFSFWLAGFGAYLLIRDLVGDHRAALVGGLAFAFCPYMTAHALGHFNLISIGWTPLFLRSLLRSQEEKGWKQPALGALFLILQLYSEFILGIFALMLAAGWLLLAGPKGWRSIIRSGGHWRLAAIFGGAGLALAPYLAAAWQDGAVSELVSKPSWFGANEHSAALASFFVPSQLHPVWAPIIKPLTDQFHGTPADNVVYLGWPVLILAAIGLWGWRSHPFARRAAVLSIFFVLLALGPTLHFVRAPVLNAIHIDDANVTPGMPYILFHWIPVLRQLRIPTRFVVVAMLMLAILAAAGVAWISARWTGRRSRNGWLLAAGCAVVILSDFTVFPHITTSAEIPSIYGRLASLPAEAVVLDLPFGYRDGIHQYGRINERSLYYQTVHHRPIVGGYIARMPDRVVDRYRSYVFLDEVATRIQFSPAPRACVHEAGANAEKELEELKVGAVIVDTTRLEPKPLAFVRRHLEGGRWERDGATETYYPKWVVAAQSRGAQLGAPTGFSSDFSLPAPGALSAFSGRGSQTLRENGAQQ